MKKLLFLFSILILSGCNKKENLDVVIDDYISAVKVAAGTPRYGLTNVILKLQTIRTDFRKQNFYSSCKDVQKDVIDQMAKIEDDFLGFLSDSNDINNSKEALSNLVKLRKEKSCTSLDKIKEREMAAETEEKMRWEKRRKACDTDLIDRLRQITTPVSSDINTSMTDNIDCSYELKEDLISYKKSLERIEELDSVELKKVSESLTDINKIKNDIEKLETKNARDLFKKHFKNIIKNVTIQTNRVFEKDPVRQRFENLLKEGYFSKCSADITIKNNTIFFVESIKLEPEYITFYRENVDREYIYGLAPNKKINASVDAKEIDVNRLTGESLRNARKTIKSNNNITTKGLEEGEYCSFPKEPILKRVSLKNNVVSKAKIKNEYKAANEDEHSHRIEGCEFSNTTDLKKMYFSGKCSELYSKEAMDKDLMEEEDVASLIRQLKEKTENKINIAAELPIKSNKETISDNSAKPIIKFNGIVFDDIYFYINKKKLLEKIIEKHQKHLM